MGVMALDQVTSPPAGLSQRPVPWHSAAAPAVAAIAALLKSAVTQAKAVDLLASIRGGAVRLGAGGYSDVTGSAASMLSAHLIA